MTGPYYRLPDAELFASGTFHGKRYSPAFVEDLARNTKRLERDHPYVPFAEVGHSSFSDSAPVDAGVVNPTSLHVIDDRDCPGEVVLVGEVQNVPEPIAGRIRRGEITRGSAELIEDLWADGQHVGPVLRSFAVLPREMRPEIKRLGILPRPVQQGPYIGFPSRPLSVPDRHVMDERTRQFASWAAGNARRLAAAGHTPASAVEYFCERKRQDPAIEARDVVLELLPEVHKFHESGGSSHARSASIGRPGFLGIGRGRWR